METTPFAQALLTEAGLPSLRDIYPQRLQRLLRLRHQHGQELNRQGIRLLDHSVFAAYCDCREVGLEEEAREILREVDVTLQQPTVRLTMRDAVAASRLAASSRRSASGSRPAD